MQILYQNENEEIPINKWLVLHFILFIFAEDSQLLIKRNKGICLFENLNGFY